jgi:hypothetical protein
MLKPLFEKDYPFGFSITKFKGDKDYTITGNLSKGYRFREFDGNYDVEKYLQKHIDCEGIEFDSEYCQFFAYAKTEKRAVRFCDEIQHLFDRIEKLIS